MSAVRRLLARAALAAAALGPAARGAHAQMLQFGHLGVEDGLPSSQVTDIARDRRGFMWIGTAHGVSRYDGYHFRVYAHDDADPASIPDGTVAQVYEDRRGTIWAVTPGGLSRYDAAADRFATYMRAAPGTPAPALTSVVEDGRGTLWVGTTAGLYRFDRRTGIATRAALPPTDPSGPAVASVMTLFADRDGRAWVGTRHGLYQLDDAGGVARAFAPGLRTRGALPDTVVRALAQDAAGDVWVGMDYAGLARLDARSGRFERFRHDAADPHSLARDRVVRLIVDRAGGGLWVGTENGGLDYLDLMTRQFAHHRFDPNTPAGIGSNSIWSLYQGADGAVWVGTFSAGLDVSHPDGGAIRRYATVAGDPTSLSYNAVTAFAEDRRGHVWVATDGGGVNDFDPTTRRFRHYTAQNAGLAADAVVSAQVDRWGTLWVGTWGGGLAQFDARHGRFHAYTTATTNIPTNNTHELLADRAGRLWVGTEDAEVVMFDRARGTFTRRFAMQAPGMARTIVWALVELHDGRLAAATRLGGLAVIDPATGAVRHFVAGPGGLSSNDVRGLFEAEPGVLWVATGAGLDQLDLRTGRATHYGVAEGLPSPFVEAIVGDDTGRLWVTTDGGLVRIDPRPDAAGHLTGVRAFGRADGVQGAEFLPRSAFRAHDGTLYFGGNGGFTAVRPGAVETARRAPSVAISGLQLFNRPVTVGAPGSPLARALDSFGPDDALTLAASQNVVTFEFAAPDYASPKRTRYAYRLDGFDAAWQEVGGRHTASYTNLAPGHYTFRVRATSGPATAGPTKAAAGVGEASLRLVVRPPVWETWWFRLLAAGAGLVGVWRLLRFQQRRRIEVALGRQALRDPLTGLANRALFRDRVEHALARFGRQGAPGVGAPSDGGAGVAVLFLDLDDFKTVNDSLGHHAGDGLLCAVAGRLLNATRGCDTVARLGGDEFAVLIENAGAAHADLVAGRIAAALRAPVPLGGAAGEAEARVGVSVGIAFAAPGDGADELLRNADAAMYRAKGEGKGRHAVFDPALVAAAAERLELARDLAHALERGELVLNYQPIVSLATRAVTGAEALLRWRHPARGMVSPAQFVPLAEGSGLIVEVGRWVLEEACREAAAWPAVDTGLGGARGVGVTVNVSGRQLIDPALPSHVAAALAHAGLPPTRLTLEITESVLMHDTDVTLATLRALKALGVRLAVDDFGTGYSSLRYLQQFPVDVLKVDKSFVDGVAKGAQDAALARTIVALGDMLALRTVAEGVETAAQADALRAMGCEYGQGYLFARPLDAAGIRARLAEGAAEGAAAGAA